MDLSTTVMGSGTNNVQVDSGWGSNASSARTRGRPYVRI